jgi:hypothetical protein
MEYAFLKSLVIIFSVSAFVVFVLHRFRIPSIAGFLWLASSFSCLRYGMKNMDKAAAYFTGGSTRHEG